MTNSSRLTTIRVLAFGVLVLATSSWAQERPPIAEQIGKTHGLDSFGQIEGIRYTFNAVFPGVKLERGSRSPRPTRSPTRVKTRRASR